MALPERWRVCRVKTTETYNIYNHKKAPHSLVVVVVLAALVAKNEHRIQEQDTAQLLVVFPHSKQNVI